MTTHITEHDTHKALTVQILDVCSAYQQLLLAARMADSPDANSKDKRYVEGVRMTLRNTIATLSQRVEGLAPLR